MPTTSPIPAILIGDAYPGHTVYVKNQCGFGTPYLLDLRTNRQLLQHIEHYKNETIQSLLFLVHESCQSDSRNCNRLHIDLRPKGGDNSVHFEMNNSQTFIPIDVRFQKTCEDMGSITCMTAQDCSKVSSLELKCSASTRYSGDIDLSVSFCPYNTLPSQTSVLSIVAKVAPSETAMQASGITEPLAVPLPIDLSPTRTFSILIALAVVATTAFLSLTCAWSLRRIARTNRTRLI